MELINKKEFAKIVLYKNFVIYIISLNLDSKILIHLIKKPKITLLLLKKVIIQVKYLDFANVILKVLCKVFFRVN